MEIEKHIGKEEREAAKEKGTRFVTRAGVHVQGSEADTGSPVAARSEQIHGFYSKKLDKDPKDTTPRTPGDQDGDHNQGRTKTTKTTRTTRGKGHTSCVSRG